MLQLWVFDNDQRTCTPSVLNEMAHKILNKYHAEANDRAKIELPTCFLNSLDYTLFNVCNQTSKNVKILKLLYTI
jgi:hypothetical protein